MIEKLLDVGGPRLLLPILIAIAALYVARGVFGLHTRMAQRRKEFLELWSSDRARDDFWLQVATRHLFGRYLPAVMVRRVMSWPDAAESLLAVAELWPMLKFDGRAENVQWKRMRYERVRNIWLERVLTFGCYVVAAGATFAAAAASFLSELLSLTAVSYAVIAVLLGMISFALLSRDDQLEAAIKRGPELLSRINALSESGAITSVVHEASSKIEEPLT